MQIAEPNAKAAPILAGWTCRICGSNAFTNVLSGIDADQPRGEKIPIVRCNQCATDQSVLSVSQSEPQLYSEGYYGTTTVSQKSLIISFFQVERRFTAFSPEGLKNGDLVLDVGCGDGVFLAHLPLNKNLQIWGYEPSLEGQKQLNAKGIRTLDLYDPPADLVGKFAWITLWHSFEHVEVPAPLLEAVEKLLKPGGQLFMSVPNFRSWQSRFFGASWFHLDPIRHVLHYNPRTLSAVVSSNSSLTLVSQSTFSLEYGVFGWWQSFMNSCGLEFNLAYKMLKRGYRPPMSLGKRTALIFAGALFLGPSFIMTVLESLFGAGPVVHGKWRRENAK